jgi:RHS repeat-associated protein
MRDRLNRDTRASASCVPTPRQRARHCAQGYDEDVVAVFDPRNFYHPGALGSVMEITDMNEAEVVSYRYDPYGAVTITVGGTLQSSDPLGNPWTYTGRFHDEETGLYYYRARYYPPETGRFLQRDPEGLAVGSNLYEYTRGRPVVARDPTGRDPDEPGWKMLLVPPIFWLTGCGGPPPKPYTGPWECKCYITCEYKNAFGGHVSYDQQIRSGGSCTPGSSCKESCSYEAEDAKHDADDAWESAEWTKPTPGGIPRKEVPITNKNPDGDRTGGTSYYKLPERGHWKCWVARAVCDHK